jgi:hypothetical protein
MCYGVSLQNFLRDMLFPIFPLDGGRTSLVQDHTMQLQENCNFQDYEEFCLLGRKTV